ncbi:hypothetical protein CesoFtcFv8_005629 [Champsocephalus esox]|uniref:Uncharacterized protein n=1 Tax=Champsocephalus esox TaxID=159716 RepID=A0AAN8H9K6_9TELE|nr:hypothetical protein CesoFtcFv8_005629 [Champsocephalus esox]
MDKLKSVLSGEEAGRDNRTVLETVNEASTLGWGTRVKGFVACFVVGGGVHAAGSVCALHPEGRHHPLHRFLHFRKHLYSGQHHVPDGSAEAAEEDV